MAAERKLTDIDDLDREGGAGAIILGLVIGLAVLGIVFLIFATVQNSKPRTSLVPVVSAERATPAG